MPDPYDEERTSLAHYQTRAPLYDWANRLAALLRGVSATKERRKAVERLGLRPGQSVVEVSVGTGTNLRLLRDAVGSSGHIAGLDISPAMLEQCRRKMLRQSIAAELVLGEGAHLPFPDGAFDAVFHHGGLAEFGDRKAAIDEMARIARPGARVVICDVGVPADRKLPLISRLLLRTQPVYDKPPPLDLLPEAATDVSMTWFHGGSWYLIEFVRD